MFAVSMAPVDPLLGSFLTLPELQGCYCWVVFGEPGSLAVWDLVLCYLKRSQAGGIFGPKEKRYLKWGEE